MISVEDWAEIRRLHFGEGLGIKTISGRLGLARNTVRSAVRSDAPPAYRREGRGSIVDAVEPQVRELLAEFPTMPATVIAERIGWERGITVLKDRIRELRPLYKLPDPAQRTTYRPGELAQWDLWQPDVLIPLGHGQADKLWVVAGVPGFSRFIGAHMIATRAAHDVLGGMAVVLGQIGAVPRTAVWDQEGCIGQWRKGKQVLTEPTLRFCGTLGMGMRLCAPADPEAKGVVERANGYLETSFLPGRCFEDIYDFNAQMHAWLTKRANKRIHATTRVRPAEAIYEDRGSMLAFPPQMPDTRWRTSTRLPRDHFVRVDTNDYSVNPRYVGRRVDIAMSLGEVTVSCGGIEVARHRRCLAKHQTLIDPDHARVLQRMRTEAKAADIFAAALNTGESVEQRDLSAYDQAFGVA